MRAIDAETAADLAADFDNLRVPRSAEAIVAQFGEKPRGDDDLSGDGFDEDYIGALRTAVDRSKVHRSTVLVILDSGWPTDEDKAKSLHFFDSLATELRKKVGITAISDDPIGRWRYAMRDETMHPHAEIIAKALAPLRAFTDPKLTIVYFPLSVPRRDSAVLRRILLTEALLKHRKNQQQLETFHPCHGMFYGEELWSCFRENPLTDVPPDVDASVSAAVERATSDRTRRRFSASLATTIDVFNAIWGLLDFWSASNNNATTFINASWTAKAAPDAMRSEGTFNGNVLTIAATGNEGVLLRRSEGEDFHQRSFIRSGSPFILVWNRRMTGSPMCNSTEIDADRIGDRSNVLFHFGLIEELDQACGSSFATPRVAWTLAFAELLRSEACPADADRMRRLAAVAKAKADKRPERWPLEYLKAAAGKQKLLEYPDYPDCS